MPSGLKLSTKLKQCVDCQIEGITTKRKLATKSNGSLEPGPRCVTHQRARKSRTRFAAWEKRLMSTYGLRPDQYWAIYDLQGGCCYICRRATGTGKKKLSVDHCHKTGRVRGLLCAHDNRDVVGYLRDDPDAFLRGAEYLNNPPAITAGVNVIVPTFLNDAGD